MINPCMASLTLAFTRLSTNLQSLCWSHSVFKRSRSIDLMEAKIAWCFWWLCWILCRWCSAPWPLGGLALTITTLGVGPLTSLCTMPNRWLYILELPRVGGGVRCGSPTTATGGTSLWDALVWLPVVRLAGLGTGEWGGSWSRYHGDHRRGHSLLPLGVEELSLRSPHPALGHASLRPRSLSRIHQIAEKSLLNPQWSRRSNYIPTDFAIYIL